MTATIVQTATAMVAVQTATAIMAAQTAATAIMAAQTAAAAAQTETTARTATEAAPAAVTTVIRTKAAAVQITSLQIQKVSHRRIRKKPGRQRVMKVKCKIRLTWKQGQKASAALIKEATGRSYPFWPYLSAALRV